MQQTNLSISDRLDFIMLQMPQGKIEMRDDRKKTKWLAEIASFRMSRFPVTQEVYLSVVGENPATFKGDKKPVETVSWLDAVAFCNALSVKMGLKPCYLLHDAGADRDERADGFHLPTSYRVFRGGGWNDQERGCLASNRRRSHPTYKMDDLGFRIVKSG